MEYVELGDTGLKVSKICFGALTIGPNQKNYSLEKGSELIVSALKQGINFIDTATTYRTYPYIKEALSKLEGKRVVIASKSYAYTAEGMKEHLFKGLKELDRDKIEIFLLHEQESRKTLEGHRPALEYLLKAKDKGLVEAVGISSHTVDAVDAAADMPQIDVIHPLINKKGIGIVDGSKEDMLRAIKKAHAKGKGIYAMKPFAGGHLIPEAREALNWLFSFPYINCTAAGIQSEAEIKANIAWAQNLDISKEDKSRLRTHPRHLKIENWCTGCGRCVKRCSTGALKIVNEQAVVDHSKCVLCSYCAPECPEFCIRIT